MGVVLRDYQLEAVEALRKEMRAGKRRVILCAPTGSGKTEMAMAVMQGVVAGGNRAIFIADRLNLVDQTSQRLHAAGMDHGIVQAENDARLDRQIIVASAQSLEKRGRIKERFDPDLIIVDECHTQRKMINEQLVEDDLRAIGLSATPLTDGLAKTWQAVVNARTTNQLLNAPEGWLAPLRVIAPEEAIDMTGAKTTAGEWQASEVEKRGKVIYGDILTTWVERTTAAFSGPVPTLVFTATVQAGRELAGRFQQHGYDFRVVSYLDGDNDERRDTLKAFREGECTGLINCEVLVKGADFPSVKCLIDARPYRKSLASYVQMLGRAMRQCDGKEFALVLDHTGNHFRFEDERIDFWANGVQELWEGKPEKKPPAKHEHKDVLCRARIEGVECRTVIPPRAEHCPSCGAARPARKSGIKNVHATMVEVETIDGEEAAYERAEIWKQACLYATENVRENVRDPDPDQMHARRRMRARVAYKEIVGRWPAKGVRFDPADAPDAQIQALFAANFRRWLRARRAA